MNALQTQIRTTEHRARHRVARTPESRTTALYEPPELDNFLYDQSEGDESTFLAETHFWVLHTLARCRSGCVTDRSVIARALRICRMQPLAVTESTLNALTESSHRLPVSGSATNIVPEEPPAVGSSTSTMIADQTCMFWLRFGMLVLPLTVLLWSAIRRGSHPLYHVVKRLFQPMLAATGRTGYFPLMMLELAQRITATRMVTRRGIVNYSAELYL